MIWEQTIIVHDRRPAYDWQECIINVNQIVSICSGHDEDYYDGEIVSEDFTIIYLSDNLHVEVNADFNEVKRCILNKNSTGQEPPPTEVGACIGA